jgi:mRNA-decapping enzyme subunit 2
MSIQLTDGLANQSVDLVLEDLLVRFLVNVPDEDLSSIERVFFQIEEAQWFYTDFVRQLNPLLPSMKMKSFATKLLKKCPLIWKWGDPADAISRFGKYKSTIPVRGVALFNKDLTKVVLVKGTESNAWSFPRGKISKDETDIDCAVREAEEETGFNARDLVNENDVIERTIKGKNYKIYLVKNVPEDYNFEPLARNEISKIQWHDMKSIQKKSRSNPNNFFIVSAILKPMLGWINKNKGVLNEEELMLQAEIKLKSLLGISQPKLENLDAGRELLNILQGVIPRDSQVGNNTQAMPAAYDQIIQMNLPQHLHKQFPFFNNQPIQPQPYPIPNQPFFVPQMPPNAFAPMNMSPVRSQPAHYQPMPPQAPHIPREQDSLSNDYINQQPNPLSLQKPTSIANRRPSGVNSKEFLSILNKPRNKEDENTKLSDESRSNDHVNNRSKAQHLLSLFNKDKKTASDDAKFTEGMQSDARGKSKNGSSNGYDHDFVSPHEASNELEESLIGSDDKTNRKEAGKKLTLLKRPTDAGSELMSSNSSASADILRMLGSAPKAEPKKETEDVKQNQSNEILGLLKGDKKEPEQNPNNRATAKELLGLINQKSTDNRKVEDQTQSFNTQPEPEINTSPEEEDFDDFEDFEDFENLDEYLSRHGPVSNVTSHNFDIASDDEDIYETPQNSSINAINEIQDTHAEKPVPDSKKNKIRLLKPGESLNDIIGKPDRALQQSVDSTAVSKIQDTTQKKDNVNDGRLLLDILNGGKNQNKKEVNQGPPKDYNYSPNSMDFGSVYGPPPTNNQPSPGYFSPNSAAERTAFSPFENSNSGFPINSQTDSPSTVQSHNNSNPASASLLSLLGKKPPAQLSYEPSPKTQSPQPASALTLDEIEGAQLGHMLPQPVAPPQTHSYTSEDASSPKSRPAEGQASSARTLLDLLKGGRS